MNALQGKSHVAEFVAVAFRSLWTTIAVRRSSARPRAPRPLRSNRCYRRSERWGNLMAVAQRGKGEAYELLLRESNIWIRRYQARRFPRPAAEDPRQNAPIHVKRCMCTPSRSFGVRVSLIARYKWIDRVRDASRFAALPLHEEMPIEDHGPAAKSAVSVDVLLGQLKLARL
jgi:hypothetical protein